LATILIIDDEAAFRRALRLALGASGHEVIEAATGAEALEYLRTQVPELILLDWQMPGLDGLQACRAIRSACAAPIIMLTGRPLGPDKSCRGQALAAGAVDYVTKPFELSDLLAHVDGALAVSPLKKP